MQLPRADSYSHDLWAAERIIAELRKSLGPPRPTAHNIGESIERIPEREWPTSVFRTRADSFAWHTQTDFFDCLIFEIDTGYTVYTGHSWMIRTVAVNKQSTISN